MADKTENRRKHERVAAVVKIRLFTKDDEPSQTVEIATESLDVSQSGVLINTTEALEIHQKLIIELMLDDSLRMNHNWPKIEKTFPDGVRLPARVVRCKGAQEIGYEVALEFSESDREKRQLIQSFLTEVQQA